MYNIAIFRVEMLALCPELTKSMSPEVCNTLY
jgi:hypothetical protein